jgi:hypothetical protein
MSFCNGFYSHIYEFLTIKIILECYYLYYKMFGGLECTQLRKSVLPLLIRFHKTMDDVDKNLVCDINDLLQKLMTIRTLRQLRKFGFLIYEVTRCIPDKHYKRYQLELRKLKEMKSEYKPEQFYETR